MNFCYFCHFRRPSKIYRLKFTHNFHEKCNFLRPNRSISNVFFFYHFEVRFMINARLFFYGLLSICLLLATISPFLIFFATQIIKNELIWSQPFCKYEVQSKSLKDCPMTSQFDCLEQINKMDSNYPFDRFFFKTNICLSRYLIRYIILFCFFQV